MATDGFFGQIFGSGLGSLFGGSNPHLSQQNYLNQQMGLLQQQRQQMNYGSYWGTSTTTTGTWDTSNSITYVYNGPYETPTPRKQKTVSFGKEGAAGWLDREVEEVEAMGRASIEWH